MSDPESRDVEAVRAEIDGIDESLVRLLSRRAELAQEIGRLKGRDGKPFFTPEREREIFDRLRELNPGPLRPGQLESVFREIVSAARAAEKPLTVAYWGPPGTFSHLAALQTFGTSAILDAVESIDDAFQAVDHGAADYAVVPIENSVAGVIPQTLDMFPRTNVKICAERYVSVHHGLVSVADSLDSVKRVYAGIQPFQQCRRWLREHLRHAEIVEVVPTSAAAQKAMSDPESAAIANKLASETLGIPFLAERIEDDPHNRTRFLVVGFNEPAQTGNDKTSLMFNLRNQPGELYRALGALYAHSVNLMMIESRPAPRAGFEYLFYVDCVGHRLDAPMTKAIEALKSLALETTVLGSYPAAE